MAKNDTLTSQKSLQLLFYVKQGMYYIHNSILGSHGRLKSSNCLVDSRWMVKVTDYGVAPYMADEMTDDSEEHQVYKSLYHTPSHTDTTTPNIHKNVVITKYITCIKSFQ